MKEDQDTLRTNLYWLLLGLTIVVYWRVPSAGFVNYDDAGFVFANPHVYSGLSFRNFIWALTTLNGGASSYHPLTWLSHQLDCQLFDLRAGPQHLTNLWFHVANTLLLFRLLDTLTSKPLRSAFVAALFALHPLHVETVAWISERKSLVCVFFWLLTTLAYVRYTRTERMASYLWVVVLYAAALLSKPIAVSLPITLILLDYWPLGRLKAGIVDRALASTPAGAASEDSAAETAALYPAVHRRRGKGGLAGLQEILAARLVLEKIPLILLTGLACLVTVLAQSRLGATKSLLDVPMSVRGSNAPVACMIYLRKLFWPVDLAPIYPLRHDWAWWQVGGCVALLAIFTFYVVWQAAKRPYLLVGWFWYLVTLLPTIGLVQVGSQGMADRYSYVPLIGLFMLTVWGLAELADRARLPKMTRAMGAAVLVLACAVSTFRTAQYWRDSLGLFQHAVRVTEGNYIAHCQLGLAWVAAGNLDEAEKEFRQSLAIRRRQPVVERCLGNLLFQRGDSQGALEHYSRALNWSPLDAQAHGELAMLYLHSKDDRFHDAGKALEHARIACELSHYRQRELVVKLAESCEENQKFEEARATARMALELCAAPQEAAATVEWMTGLQRRESRTLK